MRRRNRELAELFDQGFGMHHAGMLRPDRSLTERMFSDGIIKVRRLGLGLRFEVRAEVAGAYGLAGVQARQGRGATRARLGWAEGGRASPQLPSSRLQSQVLRTRLCQRFC